jgi:hypothetical protein
LIDRRLLSHSVVHHTFGRDRLATFDTGVSTSGLPGKCCERWGDTHDQVAPASLLPAASLKREIPVFERTDHET